MKAIVTGALGFIGSHLTDYLADQLDDVIGIDYIDKSKSASVNKIKKKNVIYKNLDITNPSIINSKYFKNIDYVFHLAGRSDVVPSITEPVSYHNVNVTGTLHMLEASRKNKIKKFIYAASSSCYGKTNIFPTPETAPVKPEYPYALTKWMGEEYALHYEKVYKLPVVSLRFFNVYGPKSRSSLDYGPVFSTFIPQLLHNKPFTVVGSGKQTRDFTYVTDVVRACFMAAKSNISGEVFNVATGEDQSINYLVELLGGGKVVHMPKRPGEPDKTHADINKIKRILKWYPLVSFPDGVEKILKEKEYWKNAAVWTPAKIKKATASWFKYLK